MTRRAGLHLTGKNSHHQTSLGQSFCERLHLIAAILRLQLACKAGNRREVWLCASVQLYSMAARMRSSADVTFPGSITGHHAVLQ